jgi:hypothetical protein
MTVLARGLVVVGVLFLARATPADAQQSNDWLA